MKKWIALSLLVGCASRPLLMNQHNFDEVQIGAPLSAVEESAGKPYASKALPDGSIQYEYVERFYMGDEVVEERRYYVVVKDGVVVSKSLNRETPPAYDMIYDGDPNDTELQ